MAHWSEAYVGRPYVAGSDDCAALAVAVQREVFGRVVDIPGERPCGLAESAALIARLQVDHAQRIEVPVDGTVVLMRRGACSRPWHVGTYFDAAGEGWILHSTASAGAATVIRLRDLSRFGLQVEGFYTWI